MLESTKSVNTNQVPSGLYSQAGQVMDWTGKRDLETRSDGKASCPALQILVDIWNIENHIQFLVGIENERQKYGILVGNMWLHIPYQETSRLGWDYRLD